MPPITHSVLLTGQQPIHNFVNCVGRVVLNKLALLIQGRWQASQIEGYPAQPGQLLCRSERREPFISGGFCNKSVDWISRRGDALRDFGPDNGFKRPEILLLRDTLGKALVANQKEREPKPERPHFRRHSQSSGLQEP